MDMKSLSKNGIFIGIVGSSIFTYFIQPIFSKLWILLNSFTNKYIKEFIDSIYINAAIGKRNWLDFLIFSYINVVFISICFTVLLILITRDHITKTKNDPTKKPNIIVGKLIWFSGSKIHRITLSISIMFLTYSTSKLLFRAYVDLQVNASFEQRLSIIAPSIDDLAYKKIKAKWSSMNSQNDYREINNEIDSIAELNKIKITKPLY